MRVTKTLNGEGFTGRWEANSKSQSFSCPMTSDKQKQQRANSQQQMYISSQQPIVDCPASSGHLTLSAASAVTVWEIS